MFGSEGDIRVNMAHSKCEQTYPRGAVFLSFTAAVYLTTLSLDESHVYPELPLNDPVEQPELKYPYCTACKAASACAELLTVLFCLQ